VRRETAGAYLKAAGIAVQHRVGGDGDGPERSASELIPDSSEAKPANEVITDPGGKQTKEKENEPD
jgi:hypothetical protein